MVLRLVGLLGTTALAVSILCARTLTVDDDGAAEFTTIQAAIDAATAGDVILVASGLYLEHLELKAGIALLGSGPSETIVDAGGEAPVATLIDCDVGTWLEGFRLSGGLADRGGGVLIQGGSPTVTRNEISGNSATPADAELYGYGGGLALVETTAIVSDNTIHGNDADFGGGVSVEGGSPTVARNVITGNRAGAGGGLDAYTLPIGDPLITANLVTGNIAIFGGGLELAGIGTPIVTNNLIHGNEASGSGNGSGYGGGIDAYYSNAGLTNNTVAANTARVGGGVAMISDGASSLVNNILHSNTASRSGGGADVQSAGIEVSHNLFHLNEPEGCSGSWAALCDQFSNLETDPLFVFPDGLDFRLRPGSPAIDSGLGAGTTDEDVRGQRRPLDGDADLAPAHDRGAHEYDRNDVLDLGFASPSMITWDGVAGAATYHVYSGLLAELRDAVPSACRDADDEDLSDLSFFEPLAPAPGDVLVFLVSATIDGQEGTIGYDHRGLERTQVSPCP